jgi:hypothetical protein
LRIGFRKRALQERVGGVAVRTVGIVRQGRAPEEWMRRGAESAEVEDVLLDVGGSALRKRLLRGL